MVALLVIAAAPRAVVASAIRSSEPAHTMPDGSTMDGGAMRK
jgi:hypothetical protein